MARQRQRSQWHDPLICLKSCARPAWVGCWQWCQYPDGACDDQAEEDQHEDCWWTKSAKKKPGTVASGTTKLAQLEALTRSISSIAIAGFVRAVCLSFGTPARAMRSGSSVQLSGRNRRRPTIVGTSRDANVTETSD